MIKIEDYLVSAVTLLEAGQVEVAKELGQKYLEVFSNQMVKEAKKTYKGQTIAVKSTKENFKKYIIEQLRLSDSIIDQIFYQQVLTLNDRRINEN